MSSDGPPPIAIPDPIRRALRAHGEDAVRRAEAFLATAPRRCVRVTSECVRSEPLKGGVLSSFFLGVAPPILPPGASKWGGTTYATSALWPGRGASFVGQIDLAAIPDVIRPPELPARGLLAIDLDPARRIDDGFAIRWYPDPSDAARIDPGHVPSVGAYEARMVFRGGWSLPEGRAWQAAVPEDDGALRELWTAWRAEGYVVDPHDDAHRILGHRSGGLDEPYGLVPPEGGSYDIDAYEMLMRISFDRAADLRLGSNVFYVIVLREDLEAGRLERAVVTNAIW